MPPSREPSTHPIRAKAARATALLDSGGGRRLDRLGSIVVDRPQPGASGDRLDPQRWELVDARFDRGDRFERGERGERGDRGDRGDRGLLRHSGWTTRDGVPIEAWTIDEGDLRVELRLAPAGGVGWFPEQADDRRWIRETTARLVARAAKDDPPPTVLDLFAHTGGGTLAAALGGASVTHVDAARSAVAWARRNAELSGLAERPIRWIADDAASFVRRERRRGRRYGGIVLDPPTYGHGPDGRPWRLDRDLPALLRDCVALLLPGPGSFVVLTAHADGLDAPRLRAILLAALDAAAGGPTGRDELTATEIVAVAESGARLGLGSTVRWRRAGR